MQGVPFPLELEGVVAGQPAQRGVQDVLRLDLGQVEDRHQPLFCGGRVLAGPDDLDDLVDVQQRDHQAVDQVQPVRALAEPERGAAADDLDPVVDVDLQQLTQAENARLTLDERHVIDAERLLHRRQPVQLVEHRLGHEPGPHLDDQAQPVAHVSEVLDVCHAVELPGSHQVLDAQSDSLRADSVRQFGDHDPGPAGRYLLDSGCRPGSERAATCLVGFPDAV